VKGIARFFYLLTGVLTMPASRPKNVVHSVHVYIGGPRGVQIDSLKFKEQRAKHNKLLPGFVQQAKPAGQHGLLKKVERP
jgi:hypothetical protein